MCSMDLTWARSWPWSLISSTLQQQQQQQQQHEQQRQGGQTQGGASVLMTDDNAEVSNPKYQTVVIWALLAGFVLYPCLTRLVRTVFATAFLYFSSPSSSPDLASAGGGAAPTKTSSVYNLGHAKLHLRVSVKHMWMNMGYWQPWPQGPNKLVSAEGGNASISDEGGAEITEDKQNKDGPTTTMEDLSEACETLMLKILHTAGLLRIRSELGMKVTSKDESHIQSATRSNDKETQQSSEKKPGTRNSSDDFSSVSGLSHPSPPPSPDVAPSATAASRPLRILDIGIGCGEQTAFLKALSDNGTLQRRDSGVSKQQRFEAASPPPSSSLSWSSSPVATTDSSDEIDTAGSANSTDDDDGGTYCYYPLRRHHRRLHIPLIARYVGVTNDSIQFEYAQQSLWQKKRAKLRARPRPRAWRDHHRHGDHRYGNNNKNNDNDYNDNNHINDNYNNKSKDEPGRDQQPAATGRQQRSEERNANTETTGEDRHRGPGTAADAAATTTATATDTAPATTTTTTATASGARSMRQVQSESRITDNIDIFCADASQPGAWPKAVHDALHKGDPEKRDSTPFDTWLIGLDCLYHLSPNRLDLFRYARQTLGASIAAFDLLLPPEEEQTLSRFQSALLAFVCRLTSTPRSNLMTPRAYRTMLVELGYQDTDIVIVDISEHVFRPLATFLNRQSQYLAALGISLGPLRLAAPVFDWWGRSGIVRGCIVVAKHEPHGTSDADVHYIAKS